MSQFDQNAERWAAILRNSPYVLRQHERQTIADLLDTYRRAVVKAEREISLLRAHQDATECFACGESLIVEEEHEDPLG